MELEVSGRGPGTKVKPHALRKMIGYRLPRFDIPIPLSELMYIHHIYLVNPFFAKSQFV